MLTSTSSRPNVSTACSTSPAAPSQRADVVGVGHRLAAGGLDLVDDLLGRPGVGAGAVAAAAEVVDDDVGAVPGQRQGVLAAQPAAGTGDDADAALAEAI